MTIPYAMSWEDPAYARAEGYDDDHEILVALPPSYHGCAATPVWTCTPASIPTATTSR